MVRVYTYTASGLALSGIVAFSLFSSVEQASLFLEIRVDRVIGLDILLGITRSNDPELAVHRAVA